MTTDGDVKIAVIQTEQAYIKASVVEIKSDIKEMKLEQKASHEHLSEQLAEIQGYISQQRGVIATIIAIAMSIGSLIAVTVQHYWSKLIS